MKKRIKILAMAVTGSVVFGVLVSVIERRKGKHPKPDEGIKSCRLQEKEETEEHPFCGPYEAYLKRPLDFTVALMVLVLLWPVYLFLAVAVRIKLGSPVIFMQERPGKDGKIFRLYKFRTMTDERDGKGKLFPDEVRLTEFGKRLRSTSLDELPELLNILKGDMSFVGPRPLLMEYLPLYNKRQARRHEVRPGLTGLAQVHGRNAISWEEKFEWDVSYVDHVTFWTDMKVVFRTITSVFCRDGISSGTCVTMEAFTGSEVRGTEMDKA